jgi:prolyl oligopeptidase
VVIREFDLERKTFVEGGFSLPEAKTSVTWKDKDTLYVGTDFGPGSLTKSGYPRIVKEWSRNTPLSDAPTLFEGKEEDMGIYPFVFHLQGITYECVAISPTFFTSIVFLKRDDQWTTIEKPLDVKVSISHENFLFIPQSDWMVNDQNYPSGTVLAIGIDQYLKGERTFKVLFSPTERTALKDIVQTQNFLILNTLDTMKNKVILWQREAGSWVKNELEAPGFGALEIVGIDPNESDAYFLTTSDYLTPTSLWMGDLKNKARTKLQSLPSYFSTENLEIKQYEAVSKDGTHIPYFQVSPKNLPLDGNNPTLLYGYGGFQVSLIPTYSPLRGIGWLEQGGVFIEANIRGGGVFGPSWHNAARKENRQRAFDDFTAVAEDLISRKVTSPDHLAIQGGSNGGLLMGVMLTQRPDLYKAVLCQVPLLDMSRYHKLLAGASWIDEYGDPDKEEDWAFIQKYSPYHNLKKGARYPRIFFTTSTRDDRVHPGHARKMAARMQELGHTVLYYENTEGGHAGAINNKQVAYKTALEYAFLTSELLRY